MRFHALTSLSAPCHVWWAKHLAHKLKDMNDDDVSISHDTHNIYHNDSDVDGNPDDNICCHSNLSEKCFTKVKIQKERSDDVSRLGFGSSDWWWLVYMYPGIRWVIRYSTICIQAYVESFGTPLTGVDGATAVKTNKSYNEKGREKRRADKSRQFSCELYP